jgi:hypothetical protein
MVLFSTRRAEPARGKAPHQPWPLARSDLDADAVRLLDQLAALPPLPAHLFGERGFQTTGDDVTQLHTAPTGSVSTALRVGGDIGPGLRRPASLFCDPARFAGRLRAPSEWRRVKLLIRQTSRFPMAALSDGQAFRNSILAGFSDADYGEHLLLAYLNSAPIRWYHYARHRDARQGMPQLKIAHLRGLPAPPKGAPALVALEAIGRVIGERNTGISAEEQATIDGFVADALGIDRAARSRIAAWASATRG